MKLQAAGAIVPHRALCAALVEVVHQVLRRGHYALLDRHAGRIFELEVVGREGQARVDFVPGLAVQVAERRPLGRVGHHDPAPALHVRLRWRLMRDGEALQQDLTLDRAGEVQALAHSAGRRQQGVWGQG
jgi:hypothetical protein